MLCIVLVVFAGTMSVAHGHLQESSLHSDCGLCVVVHLAVEVSSGTPVLVSTLVFSDEVTAEAVVRPAAAVQAALYSRPPPVMA